MMQFIQDNLMYILSALVTLAGAVITIITLLRTKRFEKYLKDAKKRGTWCECPHCHETLYLQDLRWKLPDGDADDNLNGVPDREEHIEI